MLEWQRQCTNQSLNSQYTCNTPTISQPHEWATDDRVSVTRFGRNLTSYNGTALYHYFPIYNVRSEVPGAWYHNLPNYLCHPQHGQLQVFFRLFFFSLPELTWGLGRRRGTGGTRDGWMPLATATLTWLPIQGWLRATEKSPDNRDVTDITIGVFTIPHNMEGILPKGPYLPCVSMVGRALLAGYPRYGVLVFINLLTSWSSWWKG